MRDPGTSPGQVRNESGAGRSNKNTRTMTTDTIESAINLDALLEQAMIYITREHIDMEIAWQLRNNIGFRSGCRPDGEAHGGHRPALTVLGTEPTLSQEVKNYLAHEMVEDIYQHDLDSMTHLELRCRKEEVSRRMKALIRQRWVMRERRAA